MLKMLDLFSGLGGASSAMRERGWSVDRVEINPRLCPDRVWDDVRTFHPAGSYDLVWASPPCTEFARESMPWIRTGNDPSLDLVREAQRIIGEVSPRFWAIENVRGSLKWLRPVLGEPVAKVGACYLWGNLPLVAWPDLRGRQKQKFAGQRPDLRSKVPHEISLALALAIEAAS